MRRASGAARHTIIALLFAGLAALPLAGWVLPPIEVRLSRCIAAHELPAVPEEAPAKARGPHATEVIQPRLPPTIAPARTESRIASLWATGAALALLPWLVGLLRAAVWSRCGRRSAETAWRAALPEEQQLPKRLRLLEVHKLATPVSWGWLHPRIAVPDGFAQWPVAQQRSALLHELAHIHRRDWVTHSLATLISALLWFHPMVWLPRTRSATSTR